MAKMPNFAVGDLAKVQSAINRGLISYPTYVFVSDKNMMAFVDEQNSLKLIEGNNKKHVEYVTTLPHPTNGDKEVLYIQNGIVYTFDGEKYNPQFVDYTRRLSDIDAKINSLGTNKVDKQIGMGLSHNDFTDAYKQKVESALQSFMETDPTVPAHVKKISVTDITTWNAKSDFSGEYKDLKNKPNVFTKINGIAPKSDGSIDLGYQNITGLEPYVESKIKTQFRLIIPMYYDKNNVWIPSGQPFKLYIDGKDVTLNEFCSKITSYSALDVVLSDGHEDFVINNLDVFTSSNQFIEINSSNLAKNINVSFIYDEYMREWTIANLMYYPFYNETACLIIIDDEGNVVDSNFNGIRLDEVPLNYQLFNPIRYFDMNFTDGSRVFGTADYANDEYYIEDTIGNKHIIYVDYGFNEETGEPSVVVKYKKIDASEGGLTEVDWEDVKNKPELATKQDVDDLIVVSDEEPTEGKIWISKGEEEIELVTPSDLEEYVFNNDIKHLELLAESGMIDPVSTNNNEIYTDNGGYVYVL